MTNVCGNGCGTTCGNSCIQTTSCNNGTGVGSFAFILVLFILLVICGAAFIF